MPVTIHQEQAEAYEFLTRHKVGVLATVDPNGNPHAAAIYYSVDRNLTVSFVTKTGTKKADNLRHNNRAVLVVYDAASQTTVQLTGIATEVKDLLDVNTIFTQTIYASIDTAEQVVPPLGKLLKDGEYAAYRLSPKQVHMAVFSHSKSGEYDDLFRTFAPKHK